MWVLIIIIIILLYLIYRSTNDSFTPYQSYVPGYSKYMDQLMRPPAYSSEYWAQSNN